MQDYSYKIGMDWGDKYHAYCILEVETGKRKQGKVGASPEELTDWLGTLKKQMGETKIALSLEQSEGALINFLSRYKNIDIYPVLPATQSRYRKAFATSGAKDDPSDAECILDILIKHPEHLRLWKPEDPLTQKISILSQARRQFVDTRTQLMLQLMSALKKYYPQAITLASKELYTEQALDFLTKWPNLQALKKTKPTTLLRFYTHHNCRQMKAIQERINSISTAIPVVTDCHYVESMQLCVKSLVAQIRQLNVSIKEYDEALEEASEDHEDSSIFKSLPGAGKALVPRLIAVFGADKSKFSDAQSVAQYTGIAPITVRSGQKHVISRRLCKPRFIHQTFIEFANCSIKGCSWARVFYQKKRSQGKSHFTAIRALAYKWIRIIFKCWITHTHYNEDIYLKNVHLLA